MAGRPDWQSLTVTYPAEQGTAPSFKSEAAVGAGDSEQHTFLAPVGTFIRLAQLFCYADAPTSASAGTHGFSASVDDVDAIDATYPYGDYAQFGYGLWVGSPTTPLPPVDLPPIVAGGGVVVDATNGIVFTYTNNTTGGSSPNRTYGLQGVQVNLGE